MRRQNDSQQLWDIQEQSIVSRRQKGGIEMGMWLRV